MLNAFTPDYVTTRQQDTGKDSSIVNIVFSPAHLIVKDSRTAIDATSIINSNTESNLKVADAIDKVANVLDKNLRERRFPSVKDRIAQQTGLSINEIERIIHKKRVYDMIFYTLFLICLLYMIFIFLEGTSNANAVSEREIKIKVGLIILTFITLYTLYYFLSQIINGDNYSIIKSIINSASG
jgi:hypothetical protein